jgi:hypothetical protein
LLSGLSLRYSGIVNNRLSLLLLSNKDAESIMLLNQLMASVLFIVANWYGGSVFVFGQAYELLL